VTALAVVGLAIALVALWRGEQLYLDRAAAERELRQRALSLEERRVALEEARTRQTAATEDVPRDLLARIAQESEGWAREQVAALVQQLYAQHGEWDRVRVEVAARDRDATGTAPGWSQTRSGGWS
jgi:hypothetical protein